MAYDNQVYSAAIADGMPPALALLIVAQSKHESDNYTSPLFLDCKNAFGYGYGVATCNGHPYKGYYSIVESTHEVTAWIKRRLAEGNFPPLSQVTTPQQYAQLLNDNGYYTDSIEHYAAGLLRWFSDNVGGVVTIGIAGIAVGLIVFYMLFQKEFHVYK